MHINPNAKTETVKVTLEFFNDDGSKDIVTTEPLDARHANRFSSESRMEYGISSDPAEPSYRSLRHEDMFHDANEFFRIDMKLPLDPSSNNGIVYYFQHVEPPLKYVIMAVNNGAVPGLCNRNEIDVQQMAVDYPEHIYFMLDVPE